MARYIEDFIPVVKFDGLVTAKAVSLESTLAVTGVATFAEAPVFTLGQPRPVVVEASSATPTLGVTGSVNVATKGSATQTYTLPAAAAAPGAVYTFVCGNASGEILINPVASDKIVALTFVAIGTDADTGQISNTTTGIKNTAATNVVGDSITLISDGVLTWFAPSITNGIWATQ